MVKALFLLEFRRLLLPTVTSLLALVGAIWGIEFLISWLGRLNPQLSLVLNGILLGLLTVSGFFSGRAAFPQDLKQRHYLFFHSLPFGRGRVWMILFLASISCAVLSLGLALALRPSAVFLYPFARTHFPLLALAYLILFAAGTCFSLVYRNGATVLLSGILGSAISLAAGLVLSLAYVSDPLNTRGLYLPSSEKLDLIDRIYTGICGVSLFALYVFWSYRFFVGGEFHLFGLRVKRTLVLIASHLMLMVGWMALQETDLLVFGDDWVPEGRYYFPAWVSRDGNHVAIEERRQRHRRFTRVSIVDTRSGSLVSSLKLNGSLVAGWSQEKNLFGIFLTDDAPLKRLGYLLPPSHSLVWITPDGREAAQARLQGSLLDGHVGLGGRTLVIVKSRYRFELISNRDGTDEIKKLAASPIPANIRWYDANITRIGSRYLATTSSHTAWVIDESVREIHIPERDSHRESQYIVRDIAFPSYSKAHDHIARLFPFTGDKPRSNGPAFQWRYILPEWPIYFDESTSLFYARAEAGSDSVELWVRERRTGSWRLLTRDEQAFAPTGLREPSAFFSVFSMLQVFAHDGLAVFRVKSKGEAQWYIYDDRRNSSIPLGPSVSEGARARIREVGGHGRPFVACISEQMKRDEIVPRQRFYAYFAESGTLIRLPDTDFEQIVFVGREGDVLLVPEGGVVSVRASGETRRLWPIGE